MHESETLEYLDGRITVDPDLCNGRPTIRGLRVTVETVLGFLSAGESADEILRQYPIFGGRGYRCLRPLCGQLVLGTSEALDTCASSGMSTRTGRTSSSTASTSGMPFTRLPIPTP